MKLYKIIGLNTVSGEISQKVKVKLKAIVPQTHKNITNKKVNKKGKETWLGAGGSKASMWMKQKELGRKKN